MEDIKQQEIIDFTSLDTNIMEQIFTKFFTLTKTDKELIDKSCRTVPGYDDDEWDYSNNWGDASADLDDFFIETVESTYDRSFFEIFLLINNFGLVSKFFNQTSKNTKFPFQFCDTQYFLDYRMYFQLGYVTRAVQKKLHQDDDLTFLLYSSKNGFHNLIEFLVNNRIDDKNDTSKDINDSLYLACRNGNLETLKKLLFCGADLNSDPSFTLLTAAVEGSRLKIVKYLTENYPQIDVEVRATDSLLFKAINYRGGGLDLFTFLVSKGLNLFQIDECKNSLLSKAVDVHNFDIFKYLISQGLNVNYQNDSGKTPLLLAIDSYYSEESLKYVKYLISKGANVNIVNSYGTSPLEVAVYHNQIDIVEYLISHGADIGNSLFSVEQNLEIAKILICEGADIHQKDSWGNNAFFRSIKELDGYDDNIELFQYLVSIGENPNQKNQKGDTALIIAIKSRCYPLVKYLISLPNLDSPEKESLLILAEGKLWDGNGDEEYSKKILKLLKQKLSS